AKTPPPLHIRPEASTSNGGRRPTDGTPVECAGFGTACRSVPTRRLRSSDRHRPGVFAGVACSRESHGTGVIGAAARAGSPAGDRGDPDPPWLRRHGAPPGPRPPAGGSRSRAALAFAA